MRLAFKLVGALVLGIVLLLAVDGVLTVRNDQSQFEAAMRRDAQIVGQPLADLFGEIWARAGERRVRELVERANAASADIHFDLVTGGTPTGLQMGGSGRVGWSLESPGLDAEAVVTVLPIDADGEHVGALVLSESRAPLDRRVRRVVTRTGVLVAVTAGMSGLLVLWLGVALVGRPLHRLTDKVRRIGEGDLTGDVVLHGRDELTELARGLNQMCERLAEAQEGVRREQMARMAAFDQLRQADRLRTVGRLASEVAHELGTPLNVVSGRADLIAKGALAPDQVAESAGIIKSQTVRMSSSIRRLLDFARRQPRAHTLIDVAELAREACALLAPLAEARDVTLDCVVGDGSAHVEGARSPLQQVLANLVVNAIEAVEEGGRVRLETGEACRSRESIGDEAHWVTLSVSDDGTGIDETHREHVFEPFFTTKAMGRGTGLGLSIASGIVNEHRGWIDVDSAPGQGSTFTVYLPRVAS